MKGGSFTAGDPDDEWRFLHSTPLWIHQGNLDSCTVSCEQSVKGQTITQLHYVFLRHRERERDCVHLYVLDSDNVNVFFCCKQGQLLPYSYRCHSSPWRKCVIPDPAAAVSCRATSWKSSSHTGLLESSCCCCFKAHVRGLVVVSKHRSVFPPFVMQLSYLW